jgi:membrane-associated protease RseP (regulator of RpoE activity)
LDGYLIALIAVLAWFVILIVGHRLKFWQKVHSQVYGPFLMMKTRRGRDFIDRLSRRQRFWTAYGRISIGVTIGSMVALMLMLIWEAFLVLNLPPTAAPAPEMLIGLPGINPIIPIWYGILGIAVGIFVHEFAHGILSRVANIKIESLGILLLIFPMGAFVEPNEEQIRATSRQKRARMYAAGPATNIFVAFICLVVFVMILAPSAQPVSDGAVAISVTPNSPAEKFGISVWSEILSVDGQTVSNASDLNNLFFIDPGGSANVSILYSGSKTTVEVPKGVVITSVTPGLPADAAGIKVGMIVADVNNTPIYTLAQFKSVIENTTHSASVSITVLKYGYDPMRGKNWFVKEPNITSIFLTSKWTYFALNYPDQNKAEYRNVSYMGVGSSVFGVLGADPDYVINQYAKPFSGNVATSSLRLIALPFLGFTPVEGPMADLYEPTGAFASAPSAVYWLLLNSFYWIFWINLMLGLTNALPAVPLDGGYVFRDILKGVFERVNKKRQEYEHIGGRKPMTEEQMDRFTSYISLSISFVVLFLILWQIVGPRI